MSSHRGRVAPAALAVLATAALWTFAVMHDAEAKQSFDSPYTLDQTYNAALRLVRVDMGLKITERDPSAAYLIFDYKNIESGSRASTGTIEIVPSGQSVKVVVQLAQMPRYHETVLADALHRKLREEYGEPRVRPSPDGGGPDPADAGAE